jgi:murein DD-endopeptidase MepM/ murein hydrolase activator NlpD
VTEPLDGTLHVRSAFGPRHDGFHSGVDLAARRGVPVLAVTAGTVVYAGRRPDYGKVVDLRSRAGVVTRYAHLSAISAGIRRGAVIAVGKQLGAVGATGNASGPHLHFEVRVGNKPVDPMRYLAAAMASQKPARESLEIAEAPEPPAGRHHDRADGKAARSHTH